MQWTGIFSPVLCYAIMLVDTNPLYFKYLEKFRLFREQNVKY